MRKLIMLLMITIVFSLSGCNDGLDYSTFKDRQMNSYEAIESIEGDKYIAYYYSETCSHCNDIKLDILTYFSTLEDIDFYLLDVSKANDSSSFEDFVGTPTIFIIQNGEIVEKYIGSLFVLEFIEKYNEFDIEDLSYDFFENQHLESFQDALEIQSDAYIIYYYLDHCPHCIKARPDFLRWAWSREVEDVYFINAAEISDPDNVPSELIILNSGTPTLVIMSNGVFAKEYYTGTDDVITYITQLGDGEITTSNLTE